jgi:hypothetical protein
MEQNAKESMVELMDLVEETRSLSLALARLVDHDDAAGSLANVILGRLDKVYTLIRENGGDQSLHDTEKQIEFHSFPVLETGSPEG